MNYGKKLISLSLFLMTMVMAAQEWEYLVYPVEQDQSEYDETIQKYIRIGLMDISRQNLQSNLNILGSYGWEVIGQSDEWSGIPGILLKRVINDKWEKKEANALLKVLNLENYPEFLNLARNKEPNGSMIIPTGYVLRNIEATCTNNCDIIYQRDDGEIIQESLKSGDSFIIYFELYTKIRIWTSSYLCLTLSINKNNIPLHSCKDGAAVELACQYYDNKNYSISIYQLE